MLRNWTAYAGCALLAAGLLVACGGGEDQTVDPLQAERDAKFAELEKVKQELDDKIARVEEIHAQLSAEAQEGAEEVVELTEEERQALATEASELKDQIYEAAFEVGSQAADFINTAGLEQGQELPPQIVQAMSIKSDTDLLMAEEHITKGGDYAKAIGIYEATLLMDPDNEKVKAALAKAQELRWMSEERFANVKKGMTEEEVIAAIGPPNALNIQEYPDKNAKAWYYPKSPDRAAAAVFFRQRKADDPYKVYQLDFNAVEGQGGGEEG